MKKKLLDLASELSRRGEPYAVATIVARKAPVSAQIGDAAIVTGDGRFEGWTGGACTRATVAAEAARAIADGRPRLVALAPEPEARERPGLVVFPMTCHSGGSVEIFIEPVLPAPRLLVFGLSPVARALARLGKAMEWETVVVDADAEPASLSDASLVVTDPKDARLARPWPSVPCFAVVATQGEWDEEAAAAALSLAPDYVSVVASPKRFAEIRASLAGRAPAAALEGLKNPAGIDLHAVKAEEIALSILAEVVQRMRSPGAAATRPASLALPVSAPAEAVDPVCGMTVAIAGAKHRAEHGGRAWYFCCARCRERFVAAPESFGVAVSP
jgi:xanthine dehydrogenase accessory factor